MLDIMQWKFQIKNQFIMFQATDLLILPCASLNNKMSV